MIFQPDTATIEYYNIHVEEYIERTRYFDVIYVICPFMQSLLPGAKILDLGCGAGRDSVTFQKTGFEVVAIDAAEKLVDYVRNLGISVQNMYIEEIAFEEEFDAVWSLASLMHVNKQDLPDVLCRINRALKPKGLFFGSFKKGEGEGREQGRYFHYVDEEGIKEYFQAEFEIVSISSKESLLNVNPTIWINVMARKR